MERPPYNNYFALLESENSRRQMPALIPHGQHSLQLLQMLLSLQALDPSHLLRSLQAMHPLDVVNIMETLRPLQESLPSPHQIPANYHHLLHPVQRMRPLLQQQSSLVLQLHQLHQQQQQMNIDLLIELEQQLNAFNQVEQKSMELLHQLLQVQHGIEILQREF